MLRVFHAKSQTSAFINYRRNPYGINIDVNGKVNRLIFFEYEGFIVDGVLKIGELAELSGMTSRSIRYYEELGLIKPVGRSYGKYRLYDGSSLARLEYIRQLTEAGLSLADILRLFRVWEMSVSGESRRAELVLLIAEYRKEVEKRKAAVELVERELNLICEMVKGCEGCKALPAPETCFECSKVSRNDRLPGLIEVWVGGGKPANLN